MTATAVVATGFGGPDVLAVVDVEVPAPGPGEVTIEVRAAGVNPIDVKLYGRGFGRDPEKLPMRLGMEVAGVVTAVGPDATGPAGPVTVGDEVLAYPVSGGYAGAVVAPARVVVPKPAELTWEQAAGILLVGATAVHSVATAAVKPGETVLVHGGSGAVGILAVQLAAAEGATVLATAGARNQDLLRQVGATPLTYGPGLLERVREAAPNGVDAAIDAVGTDEAVDTSLALADPDRIVSIAAFHRGDTGIRLIGGGPGADPGTEVRAEAWRTLLPAAAEGRLRLLPTRDYALDKTADAHRLLIDGHPEGKLVLIP